MRIIFLSVLVSLFIWGCNVKSTYDISGFCDGNSLSTVVYLMEIEQGKIVDTLGQVEVLNGRFTLNGETGKDKDCRIELVDDNRKRKQRSFFYTGRQGIPATGTGFLR